MPTKAVVVVEKALLMAWARGGRRAATVIVDARRSEVAVAIARQAAAWPADLVVLTRYPKLAMSRLVRERARSGHARSGLPGARRSSRAKRPRPALREMAATGEAWAGRSGALGVDA